jgi:hypothetical protein
MSLYLSIYDPIELQLIRLDCGGRPVVLGYGLEARVGIVRTAQIIYMAVVRAMVVDRIAGWISYTHQYIAYDYGDRYLQRDSR